MSESSFPADPSNQMEEDPNALFQSRHLDLVLSNSLDSEKLRAPLNAVLNGKTMQQVERELRRSGRQEIAQAMFFMKEHYRDILDENANLLETSVKERRDKELMEKDYRRTILDLKVKNSNLQENVDRNPRGVTPALSHGATSLGATEKRSVKMPDPPLFSDGKTMPVSQWITRMKNKLFANADHFETEELKMMYILSRTEGLAAKHLDPRTREGSLSPFLSSTDMLLTLKEVFDDPNRKLTAINEFRALRMGDKDFHTFWAEFQRISFDLNYADDVLMTEMIHKLHNRIQRSIAIAPEAKNIYELAHQCQRIYEGMLQSDRTKRFANRIDQQKQRRAATSGGTSSGAASSSKALVPAPFPRKALPESKPRLFNPSPDAVPRLTSKEALILSKQGRCFKCKEFGHMAPTCESELKPMPAELKEIVELSDSEN